MKVFISWSGTRSKMVAEALRHWLKMLLQAVSPWLSSEDIRLGKRWGSEIATALKDTDFGIVCVTPENVAAPWVLFEAGALSKNLQQAQLCTFLLDMKPTDVEPPLSDFQATSADEG